MAVLIPLKTEKALILVRVESVRFRWTPCCSHGVRREGVSSVQICNLEQSNKELPGRYEEFCFQLGRKWICNYRGKREKKTKHFQGK